MFAEFKFEDTSWDFSEREIKDDNADELLLVPLSSKVDLVSLNLCHTSISDGTVECIVKNLKHNQDFELLNLGSNDLNDDCAEPIARLIGQNKALKKLYLSHNNLTDKFVEILATALEGNSVLEVLDLGFNEGITDGSSASISSLLSNKCNIRHLSLAGTKIEEGCVTAIAESLRDNNRLKHLDVSSNNLGDKHCQALIVSLNYNVTLQSICLSGNGITDAIVPSVAQLLVYNPMLQALNLAQNSITDKGLGLILTALDRNRVLQSLNVKDNKNITRQYLEEISAQLIATHLSYFECNSLPVSIESGLEKKRAIAPILIKDWKNKGTVNDKWLFLKTHFSALFKHRYEIQYIAGAFQLLPERELLGLLGSIDIYIKYRIGGQAYSAFSILPYELMHSIMYIAGEQSSNAFLTSLNMFPKAEPQVEELPDDDEIQQHNNSQQDQRANNQKKSDNTQKASYSGLYKAIGFIGSSAVIYKLATTYAPKCSEIQKVGASIALGSLCVYAVTKCVGEHTSNTLK